MSISRRKFLRQGTKAALAVGSLGAFSSAPVMGGEGTSQKRLPLPIVDTHQHLWDLSKFHLPWLKSSEELNRSFLTEDYLEATKGLNVVKAVYMEVAVAEEQKLAEAEHVIELCRRTDNPTVAAVIGGQPASEDFPRYISRFKDSTYVKGVRRILPAARGGQSLYLEKQFVVSVRLLGELGMRFDLCMPPARLPDAIRLVDECKGTRFILDHCGNADPKWFRTPGVEQPGETTARRRVRDQWRRDVATLAERENVVCKISGIVARAPKDDWSAEDLAPIINHCIEVFGPARVMFASDWPVCTRWPVCGSGSPPSKRSSGIAPNQTGEDCFTTTPSGSTAWRNRPVASPPH